MGLKENGKKYYEANKDKIAARRKAYYKAKREKIIAQRKAYEEANREKIAAQRKAYEEANREKRVAYQKEYREANREKMVVYQKAYQKAYYEANHEKISARQKAYHEKNKEKKSISGKAYQKANREKIAVRYKEHYKNNPSVRIATRLRKRIRQVLNGASKSASTMELVGCTIEELMTHIEGQLQEGMTWDNYGFYGWHLDHCRPCSSFDLTDPEQQRECFHFSNLQPLWATDNMSKGDKWEATG